MKREDLHVAQALIPPGSQWRHWKGGLYVAVDLAIEHDTTEVLVIYRDEDGVRWARPVTEWAETMSHGARRFERVFSAGLKA